MTVVLRGPVFLMVIHVPRRVQNEVELIVQFLDLAGIVSDKDRELVQADSVADSVTVVEPGIGEIDALRDEPVHLLARKALRCR